MVACTSAAFEQYLQSMSFIPSFILVFFNRKLNIQFTLLGCDDLVDQSFVFMTPTSLRKKDDLHVSNESSAYLVRVPVLGQSADATVRRVHLTREVMNIAKKSPEQYTSYWFLKLAFYFPWLVPKSTFSQSDLIHGVVSILRLILSVGTYGLTVQGIDYQRSRSTKAIELGRQTYNANVSDCLFTTHLQLW